MSEEASFENSVDNTSASDLDSRTANCDDSFHKKDSEDVFGSESDIEASFSGSYSEDGEAGGNTSNFLKESESVFENENATGEESKQFKRTKQIPTASAKSQYLIKKVLELDCSTFSLEKVSVEDESEEKQDGAEDNCYDDVEQDHTKSPKLNIKTLKADGTSNPDKVSIKESLHQELVEEGTRNKCISNADQNVLSRKKSTLSPTEGMKALIISDTSISGNKKTPRQSRSSTPNVFNSPYNTRLKARMIRERDTRSRSEGRTSNE